MLSLKKSEIDDSPTAIIVELMGTRIVPINKERIRIYSLFRLNDFHRPVRSIHHDDITVL